MKALKIISCSDSLMWYRDHVDTIVPLLRVYSDVYLSREPAGYSNIIHLRDAVIVDVEPDQILYLGEYDHL